MTNPERISATFNDKTVQLEHAERLVYLNIAPGADNTLALLEAMLATDITLAKQPNELRTQVDAGLQKVTKQVGLPLPPTPRILDNKSLAAYQKLATRLPLFGDSKKQNLFERDYFDIHLETHLPTIPFHLHRYNHDLIVASPSENQIAVGVPASPGYRQLLSAEALKATLESPDFRENIMQDKPETVSVSQQQPTPLPYVQYSQRDDKAPNSFALAPLEDKIHHLAHENQLYYNPIIQNNPFGVARGELVDNHGLRINIKVQAVAYSALTELLFRRSQTCDILTSDHKPAELTSLSISIKPSIIDEYGRVSEFLDCRHTPPSSLQSRVEELGGIVTQLHATLLECN